MVSVIWPRSATFALRLATVGGITLSVASVMIRNELFESPPAITFPSADTDTRLTLSFDS